MCGAMWYIVEIRGLWGRESEWGDGIIAFHMWMWRNVERFQLITRYRLQITIKGDEFTKL